jgi:hypothetical protein
MVGALAVWLWGPKLEDRLEQQIWRGRTKTADSIHATAATIRSA